MLLGIVSSVNLSVCRVLFWLLFPVCLILHVSFRNHFLIILCYCPAFPCLCQSICIATWLSYGLLFLLLSWFSLLSCFGFAFLFVWLIGWTPFTLVSPPQSVPSIFGPVRIICVSPLLSSVFLGALGWFGFFCLFPFLILLSEYMQWTK